MFTAEDGTRRATLKGCGFIQVFLGVTALPAAIAKLVLQTRNEDFSYSGIWTSLLYILLGAITIQCARLDSPPTREMLSTCIGVSLLVLGIFLIVTAFLTWAAVKSEVGGLIAVVMIPLVAIVVVTITAVIYATRIKNALPLVENVSRQTRLDSHGTN